MTRIPTDHLRANLAAVLARAEAGERIEVTRKGRVVAVLGPPETPRTETALAQVARELGRRVGDIERSRCACHGVGVRECPVFVAGTDMAMIEVEEGR